jgi:hypothetical protein
VGGNFVSSISVELKVFDILGRELVTLVNEPLAAGHYEVYFEIGQINRHITSGIYYYQLRYGEFIETKKMVFLK